MPVYYLILCRVVMGVPVSTRDGQTDAAGASIWSMPDRELSTIGGTSTFYHSLVAEASQGAQYTLTATANSSTARTESIPRTSSPTIG